MTTHTLSHRRAGGRSRLALLLLMGLLLLAGATPRAVGTVFTSQLGFAPGDPMIAVLAVPAGASVSPSFQVVAVNSQTPVYTSSAVPFPGGWTGNDIVGDTYLLDFTLAGLSTGRYQVVSNGSYSPPFDVGTHVYDAVRLRPLEFFRIQMSGLGSAHSWSALDGVTMGRGDDHLDDARKATRKDKGGGDTALIQQDYITGNADVWGGWSDAGDYNKYMGNTPWAAYLLLLTIEEHPDYWLPVDDNHNGLPDIREVVQPALDWMLKMQHSDGSVYERVFNGYTAQFDGHPEFETDNIKGTSDDRPLDTDRYADITAKAIYAWAAGYRMFGRADYLAAAERAWTWARANPSRVKPKVYGGGLYFGDLEQGLTLGALELYRATDIPTYLDYAAARVRNHLDTGDWTDPSGWNFQESYALMRYYDFADNADKGRIVAQLEARRDWAIARQAQNAYRMNDELLYDVFGQNDGSAAGAYDALWLYERSTRVDKRKYYDYAVNQMSWIFGRNPFGESWLASRYVTEYTRVPHWRATAKHPIEGVVVPGATDYNGNGRPDYTDTGDWYYSEPTINQQAMFVRVMTELHLASGGDPGTSTNPPPAISIVSPTSGATVSGTITVSANASDLDGVSSVKYRVGNNEVLMDRTGGIAENGTWSASLNTTSLLDGQHQITVTATDAGGRQSAPSVTVNVRNSTQARLVVQRVDVALLRKGGSRIQGRGDIFVVDAFGAPVAGATVTGHWTGSATDTFSVTTDATGKATDYSNSTTVTSSMIFTCVVDSLAKSGSTYQPGVVTQGSATYP